MLRNEPPPGTNIRLTRIIEKAAGGAIGKLHRPVKDYPLDAPNDLFYVDYKGKRIVVERKDIEELD